MIDRLTSKPVALSAVLVFGLAVLLGGCREKGLLVKTDPPGAAVWIGDDIQGVAPLEVPVPRSAPLVLRVALPNWEDAIVEVKPGEVPADRVLMVRLKRPGVVSLVLDSRPPGANVVIDGEFRGKTPLEVHNLEPRRTEVVFRVRDRAQVTRVVDLADPDGDRHVRVDLPSLTVDYYKQKIREEPR